MKFMRFKWLYFAISLVILIPGTYFLMRYGLRLSIDFTGGTLLEVDNVQLTVDSLSQIAKKQNLELSSTQSAGENTYILRFKNLDKDQNEKFKAELGKDIVEKRYESVGPTIGAELAQKSVIAIGIASLAIVVFVGWSFRDWKFGASTIFALVHDVLVVVGLFSIFGTLFHNCGLHFCEFFFKSHQRALLWSDCHTECGSHYRLFFAKACGGSLFQSTNQVVGARTTLQRGFFG